VTEAAPGDRGRALHTRAVHPPAPPTPAERPLSPPVWRAATWRFDTAQDYADVLDGRTAGYSYSRINNPGVDATAATVAELEGAEAGQAFASGMAAISTTVLAFVGAGGHVVAPHEVYGGTYGLLTAVLPRLGIETSFVDGRDPDAVAAAVRPGQTAVVWAETLANPTLAVPDLGAHAAVAHAAGALLVVDSTFASPVVCRPLDHGADLVVHSATKYLGGHSDVTAGMVVGSADLVAVVRALRVQLGGSLSPDDAWLVARGLLTLPLRVERSSATALGLATALLGHPRVARVDYPGLPSSPDHALARKQFADGVYGGVLTVTPRGDRATGMALCDGLTLIEVATSLGGVQSKVSHVASTTHRMFDDATLAAAGIGPAAVRLSVGLEDVADLLADLEQALDRLPG